MAFTEIDEKLLVRAYQAGDERAFDTIVRTQYNALYAHALRRQVRSPTALLGLSDDKDQPRQEDHQCGDDDPDHYASSSSRIRSYASRWISTTATVTTAVPAPPARTSRRLAVV